MSEHTKEPWRVADYNASLVECFDGKQTDHATTPYFVGGGADQNEREANARRIVACVNVCAGIPNEQLECDNVAFVKVFNERNALKKQRDSLLALLKNDAYAISFQTLGQYRGAIIAAVKGGAA